MKYIVTTHKNCFIYDYNTKEIININRGTEGKRWAYGVSWSGDKVYIAWRGPGEILEYDKCLKFTGRKCSGKIGDPHQIQCYKNELWAANTGGNAINIYDLKTLKLLDKWKPHHSINYEEDPPYKPKKPKKGNPRYKHYNSIMFKDGLLYVNAHMTVRNPPSKIWVFKYPQRTFVKKICGGVSTHNIFFVNNNITVCDSINSQILSPVNNKVLYKLPTQGFLRGVSVVKGLTAIGRSDICKDRNARQKAHGGIIFFKNNSFNKPNIHWIGQGPVEEIRCMDSLDEAHPTNVLL